MAQQAKTALQTDSINVLADRGYYSGQELRSCEDSNITAYVPNSATSNNKAKGQFDRSEFHYIAKDDEYQCPAGERLIYRFTRTESGKEIRRYWSSSCPTCPIHATSCMTQGGFLHGLGTFPSLINKGRSILHKTNLGFQDNYLITIDFLL